MTIIVTARVDADANRLEQVERAHPDLMEAILAAAHGRIRSHRRFGRDGETLDIDEYDSRADYEAFHAQARAAIEQLGEALGVPYRDTVYEEML
jgi:hypothetical protein